MLAPATLPVTVNQVAAAGPAAAAGLRVGDRLVTIDGTPLDGVLPDGAMMLLMNHRAGTTATLGIERGGVAQVIKLVVGSQGGLQR